MKLIKNWRNAVKLKAYLVGDPNYGWREGGSEALVFAYNRKQAISIGRNRVEYHDFDTLKAIRNRDADRIFSWPGNRPHQDIAHHVPFVMPWLSGFREMGWQCEGDDVCQACGLYSMDGHFRVCEECDNCSECGCAYECSNYDHSDD